MQTTPANLGIHLNQELAALRAFVDLLEKEQQLLLSNDADQLLPLSETKAQAATRITQLTRQRRDAWLAKPGDSMEKLLPRVAPALLTVWQNILKLAAQAQELNHINGELIQSGLRRNQQALAALQSASQHAAGLYGPDGQPSLGGSGRVLGRV
ncbi:MAG TPA: flagellar protein FlgN [Gallionellaceae bacterium]|nr:flagellar protein FlgN [Gallionellaceae bacterium]